MVDDGPAKTHLSFVETAFGVSAHTTRQHRLKLLRSPTCLLCRLYLLSKLANGDHDIELSNAGSLSILLLTLEGKLGTAASMRYSLDNALVDDDYEVPQAGPSRQTPRKPVQDSSSG